VDLSPEVLKDEAKRAVQARNLYKCFEEVGLVCVKGVEHYYPGGDAGKTLELYNQYVELLKREKDQLMSHGGEQIWYQRGYTPTNVEVGLVSAGKPDLKECWFNQMGEMDESCQAWYPEIYAQNIWPQDESPKVSEFSAAKYKELYEQCGQALHAIGSTLLSLSEDALLVPKGSFTEKAAGGCHVTRLLRYIALNRELADLSAADQINWGEEHTDMNLITVLPGGHFYEHKSDIDIVPAPAGSKPPGEQRQSGLFLRTKNNQTVLAKAPKGCFIAQVGQQLEVLSGGKFIATPHKITAPDVPGWSRCSMAHFVHLRGDAMVAPVKDEEGKLVGGTDAARFYAPPVLAGTYVLKTLVDIGLAKPRDLDKLGYRNYDLLEKQRNEEAVPLER